ncbi:bacteriocin immunity protein [Photobacterium nomapromontoriensis]|uniref:bacteriocin immunity protein n=1 Tax=Photobacterium nomapromontoriensis TaxID=2910237 RepID=UPI003D0E381F
MKSTISEHTESEFLKLVTNICQVNVSDEKEHSNLVFHFCQLVEHPDGSDLIYYPEKEEDGTPERIVEIVKAWRESKGLPLFKK